MTLMEGRVWPPLGARRLYRAQRRRAGTLGLGAVAAALLVALHVGVVQPVLRAVCDQGLWTAVCSGNPVTTQFWLEWGGNPNRQIGFPHYRPLLYHAVVGRHPEVVKVLLKAGAAPDLPGCESSTTALSAAREQLEGPEAQRCLDLLLQPGNRSYESALKQAGNRENLPDDLCQPPLSVSEGAFLGYSWRAR